MPCNISLTDEVFQDANLIDLYDETETTPLAGPVAQAYDDAAPLVGAAIAGHGDAAPLTEPTTVAHSDATPLAELTTVAHEDAASLAEPTTAAHGGVPLSPKIMTHQALPTPVSLTLPKRDIQDPLRQHSAQQPKPAEMSTSGGLPDNLKAALDAQVSFQHPSLMPRKPC